MKQDGILDNGQSQSCTTKRFTAPLVNGKEAFKDARNEVFGNTLSIVRDVNVPERTTLASSDFNVVPILAPIITLMAWPSDSSCALTNETVITVVADEDCTATVMSIPVKTPAKRLLVMADKVWRKWGPLIFCNDSLSMIMPKTSKARAPTIFTTRNAIG